MGIMQPDEFPISKPQLSDVISVTDGSSPLMLSFPHSGDVYPRDFGYDPKLSYAEIDHPSDKYVDELFGDAAEKLVHILVRRDRKSTRLNSSHVRTSRMPSSA